MNKIDGQPGTSSPVPVMLNLINPENAQIHTVTNLNTRLIAAKLAF
jgi:hypothetical protein